MLEHCDTALVTILIISIAMVLTSLLSPPYACEFFDCPKSVAITKFAWWPHIIFSFARKTIIGVAILVLYVQVHLTRCKLRCEHELPRRVLVLFSNTDTDKLSLHFFLVILCRIW